MRKFMIALATTGAALVAASPAAAQYAPAPQPAPYGYNQPYGNGYNGYGRNNWGQVRELQVRINNVQRQIDRLDRRDRIGDHAADRLRREANDLEQRLRDKARGGLNGREGGDIVYRLQRLEQRVQFAMNDRDGRYRNRW